MKYKFFVYLMLIVALVTAALPLASQGVRAQTSTLPTAAQVASRISVGWNLGNTLEAICGENAWGNPMVTQQLIDSVRAAGFNAIRIPTAWDCHANQTTMTIDPAWMARVKQVVDYAINNGMYVIINIHWDGGWLENNPTYAAQAAVNTKQNAYWTQIANYFKNYDEHLLFAGTNEVHFDYGEPTSEHIAVHQSYLQTFVNAVRATGGNNASRTLVVQTYNTNMWHGLHYLTMPTDTIANRLMVETHYYDPYDYTLNASGSCLYWGSPYPAQSACSWAQEPYMDDVLRQVKAKWVDAGIPVIVGEYVVDARPGVDLASRQYYYNYFNNAARINGIKTFYWDTGGSGSALFNRNTGAIVDQGALNAVLQGAGVGVGNPTPTTPPTRTNTPAITPTRTNTAGPTATRTRTPTAGPTTTRTRTPTLGAVTNTPTQIVGASPTRTATVPVVLTATRTLTPVPATATSGAGACSPVSSTITAPFAYDGVGTFCWQSTNLGAYINSWNTSSVTINGTNITNLYVASGSYPAKVGGYWYVTYNSSVAWGHFEAK